uniref:Uncharacterized protein n=1 Tax=Nelumbo nucifera TaxID=4432 RepID=A0A822YL70_NELNU|nr:TPA_asm: hypothetical protein HUJ06_031567 [Nelumbo nucifera]
MLMEHRIKVKHKVVRSCRDNSRRNRHYWSSSESKTVRRSDESGKR